MSDAPAYPAIIWVKIWNGIILFSSRKKAEAHYIRADLVLGLLATVETLEKDGWWAASECRFHAVRDAASKLKALTDE